jgi:Gpi18-like mannosyltransferase
MVWSKDLTVFKYLIGALIIRLLVAPFVYHDDVITNYWWGKFALDFPLRGYYDWLNFGGYITPDQPPLYILYYRFIRQCYLFIYQYLWWLNTHIPAFPSNFMQWYFDHGNQILQKIPSILADVGLITILVKKFPQITKQKLFFIFVLFFPPLFYNSTVWGGNDIILNIAGLTSLYFLYKKHVLPAFMFLTLCLLFKSSWLIFLPVFAVMLLRAKPKFLELVLGILLSLFLVFVFSHSFAPTFSYSWLTNLYLTKILPGAMPHLTANAFNLWALLFGLTPRLDDVFVFLSFNYRQISMLVSLVLTLLITLNLKKYFSLNQLLLSLVNITLVCFMFMTRMHERYTFPLLIPLLILSILAPKFKKYLYLLTFTHLLNVYHWWWVPHIPVLINILDHNLVVRTLSLINLIILLSLLRIQFTRVSEP